MGWSSLGALYQQLAAVTGWPTGCTAGTYWDPDHGVGLPFTLRVSRSRELHGASSFHPIYGDIIHRGGGKCAKSSFIDATSFKAKKKKKKQSKKDKKAAKKKKEEDEEEAANNASWEADDDDIIRPEPSWWTLPAEAPSLEDDYTSHKLVPSVPFEDFINLLRQADAAAGRARKAAQYSEGAASSSHIAGQNAVLNAAQMTSAAFSPTSAPFIPGPLAGVNVLGMANAPEPGFALILDASMRSLRSKSYTVCKRHRMTDFLTI